MRWITVNWIGLATIPVFERVVSETLQQPWKFTFGCFKDITPFDEEHPMALRSASVLIEDDYGNS